MLDKVDGMDVRFEDLINTKAATFYMENSTGLFIAFNSQEAKEAYLSDGNRDGIIGEYAIWAGMSSETVYRMEVTGLSEKYNFTSSSDKMEISVGFSSMVKHSDEEGYIEFNESAIFSVTVIKQGALEGKLVSGGNIVPKGGTFTFDLKPYVGNGDNTIIITAEGLVSSTKGVATATASVTAMALLPRNFDWWTPFIEGESYLGLGGLVILGSLSKTLHVKVTGDNGYLKEYSVAIGTEQHEEIAYTFEGLEHPSESGVYNVEMWLTADVSGLRTESLTYNIMCIASEDVATKQLVCINETASEVQNYAENKFFSYAVYNGKSVSASPLITIEVDGNTVLEKSYDVATKEANTFTYALALSGATSESAVRATIEFGNTQIATFSLDSETSFAPVEGYTFLMDAATRSNTDTARDLWLNSVDGSEINVEWKDMSWEEGMDGWTTDGDGNKCLIIPAMSRAEVDITPMKDVSTVAIEMLYKVSNVSDFDDDVIRLMTDTASSWVGLRIKPTNICLHSQYLFTDDLRQSYNTQEDGFVHLVMTIIAKKDNGIGNIAILYVNGVKKCSFEWAVGDTFAHEGKLSLGSDTADLFLYKMRVYGRAFSWENVLQNYISSLHTIAERVQVNRREESVMDDNKKIDYERVYGRYNTFVVELPKGALLPNKLNNESNTPIDGTNLYIDIVQDPSCSIQGEWLNVPIEGQGTTAMTYYRWNLRSKTSSAYGKFRITAKKNVASSMHSHKMGATRLFNDLNRAIVGPNEADGRVAVYQYPVYGFQMIEDEEVAGTYHYDFIGLYTIGPDKGDKSTFGYDNEAYEDTLIHMEGTDHDKTGIGMDYPWEQMTVGKNVKGDPYIGPKNANGGLGDEAWEIGECGGLDDTAAMKLLIDEEFAPAYRLDYECTPMIVGLASGTDIDAVNANIEEFREIEVENGFQCGSYLVYIDGEYDEYYYNLVSKTYEKDGRKVYDGLSEYGFSESTLESFQTVEEKTRYIKECRKARYLAEAGEYWDINDSLFHACFLDLIGATDNEKKNSYPYKFGTLESGSRWRWRQDDLDTIFDINNLGSADKKYSIMNTDSNDGEMVFKGNTSYHWRCIRDYYVDLGEGVMDMKKMMQAIMNKMAELCPPAYGTSYTQKLIGCIRKYFWDYAQEYFTLGAYNSDAKWTYEDTWVIYKENTKASAVHPLRQSLGSHYEAEKAWVALRMLFLASMNEWGAFVDYVDSSEGQISFRQGGDFVFRLTPAIDMRPSVIQGQSMTGAKFASGRVAAGEAVEISTIAESSADTLVSIQGADWLQDIGDFSTVRVGSTTQPFAVTSKRLQKLKVGDTDASKVSNNIASLEVGYCPSLMEIEARNMVNLSGTVDLERCPRLRKAYFGGTAVSVVLLPNGCKIQEFDLPSTIQQLTLRKLPLLTKDGLTYTDLGNLGYLWVEQNANIDGYDMLKTAFDDGSPLTNIRVIGFTKDGDATDVSFLAKLANGEYHGIDSDGSRNNSILPVLNGIINVNGNIYKDDADAIEKDFDVTINALGYYLKFADPEVLRILLEKIDTDNGIGLTTEDVEGVTSISTWFNGNTAIETFDEFKYFTGITFIGNNNTATAAFYNCTSLKSIILPSSLTSIATSCFENTALTSVPDLSNVESLGSAAFKNCASMRGKALLNVGIISAAAFYKSGIDEVEINGASTVSHNSNNTTSGAFGSCPNLKRVKMDVVEFIGNYAFYDCTSLVECILPSSIISIARSAFHNCTSLAFDELDIPNLTSLGANAFYGVKIKKLILGSLTTLPNVAATDMTYGDKSVLEEIVFSKELTTIPQYSLNGYSALRNVAGLDNITTIGLRAFDGCSSIETEINVPKLESIGDMAFRSCAIERITNLGSITSIAESSNYNGTFAQCKNLSFARMPNTLTSIGRFTFYNCSSLKTLIMESVTPPTMSDTRTLSGTHADLAICVPAASMSDYAAATNWESYKERLAPIEDYEDGGYVPIADPAVLAICVANWDTNGSGYMSKNECAAVTSIGAKFKGNTEITSFEELEYFTGLTEVSGNGYDGGAFQGCSNLEKVVLPNTITSIKYAAFRDTAKLDMIIPSSVTNIENYAFNNSGITGDINLPNLSQTTLEPYVFMGSKIKRVLSLGNVEVISGSASWSNGSFMNCTNLESVVLPETLKTFNGFRGCTSLTTITIPSGVTDVKSRALYGCSALQSVIVMAEQPPTLENIDAFTSTNDCPIYVHDAAVDTYKAETNWNSLASRIKPLSQYNG